MKPTHFYSQLFEMFSQIFVDNPSRICQRSKVYLIKSWYEKKYEAIFFSPLNKNKILV